MNIQDAQKKATELFTNGYNCSQSVLVACAGEKTDEFMLKGVATAFGAGVGREQLTCGAVTGALMALGLHIFDDAKKVLSKEIIYTKTGEFIAQFEQQHGSTECLQLLGVNIRTEQGKKFAIENNLFNTRCVELVQSACHILNEVLD